MQQIIKIKILFFQEPDTSYNPDVNIPLQVEEVDQQSAELPNYNEPVVLLLGTPDQVYN